MLPIVVYSAFSVAFLILQSTLFMTIPGLVPDFAFIVLVYSSFSYGKFNGQIHGFVYGLTLDFISLSPFGFNAMIGLLTGNLIGRGRGVVQLDIFLLPTALIFIACILKTLLVMITGLVFQQASVFSSVFSWHWLSETLVTILTGFLVFLLLNLLDKFLNQKRAYR